jgi:hypothetical protein
MPGPSYNCIGRPYLRLAQLRLMVHRIGRSRDTRRALEVCPLHRANLHLSMESAIWQYVSHKVACIPL